MGLVALFVMMRVDYHQLRRPEVIWTLLGVTVLALMAVFAFPARNGAHRWISIGGPYLAALRARESRRHHLYGRGARAADAPDQRHQVRA